MSATAPDLTIYYTAGYKYQLAKAYSVVLKKVYPLEDATSHWTQIYSGPTEAELWIRQGYAWDGPSGISVDTKNFMRGSLVHDALYQLIRLGRLPEDFRHAADEELRAICREDGMSRLRAWYVYRTVRWFGGGAAKPENERPVLIAP